MKRFILIILAVLIFPGDIFSQTTGEEESQRGKYYYDREEFDAAWLFYSRALSTGNTNGLNWYRAARSFKNQTLFMDEELQVSLYTTARYYLLRQYPQHRYTGYSESYADLEVRVTRKYLRDVHRKILSIPQAVPQMEKEPAGGLIHFFESLIGFLKKRIHTLQSWGTILRTAGFRENLIWWWENLESLIFSWIVLSFLSGVLLPLVMGIAAAKEGKKSYVGAYFLWFHWGMLGIHRFYLGRYISGVLWLLTGGFLGMGIFLDFFLLGRFIHRWNGGNTLDPLSLGTGKGLLSRLTAWRQRMGKGSGSEKMVDVDDFDLGDLTES